MALRDRTCSPVECKLFQSSSSDTIALNCDRDGPAQCNFLIV